MRGSKILYMSLEKYGIRFVDTLNYLAMPLKRIPAAMGLDIRDLKKGRFNNDFIFISRDVLSIAIALIYIYLFYILGRRFPVPVQSRHQQGRDTTAVTGPALLHARFPNG